MSNYTTTIGIYVVAKEMMDEYLHNTSKKGMTKVKLASEAIAIYIDTLKQKEISKNGG